MTVQLERPLTSEAESPEEWAAEVAVINAGHSSIDFLLDIELAVSALHRKEWQAMKAEQRRREREDAEQLANKDDIWLENAVEADRILAETCPSCFCIHKGDC